jgi:signal transduction histidine kinase
VNYRIFDGFDGVHPGLMDGFPPATMNTDGRLWFASGDSLQMIDPRHVAMNTLPPPVHIQLVVADRKTYTPGPWLRLPRLVRDLEVDYTALSLTVPEKVHFRYRLDGRDKDWQDPGTRRQAFYTDLPPGNYTFHVIASNNDGVWNTTGDSLTFLIPPAFYQTLWFKVVLGCVVAVLVWMIYLLRLHGAKAEISSRLGERLQERERIARELHDTLLQDFQAVILRFQLVANRLVKGDPRRAEVEDGLEYADKVLAEGREHIRDIRADTKAHEGLVKSLAAYGQDLSLLWPLQFTITATGEPFELYPVVRDEMYRIGREALGNAFRHSSGSVVTVEVTYTADAFVLRICDDGKGIDVDILRDGRPGHWGINNMRERARNIGASLNFTSSPDFGTCLELKIDVALANGSRTSWFRLKRKIGAGDRERSRIAAS